MRRLLLLFSLALAVTSAAAEWTLTVAAPVSLEPAAERLRKLDVQPIAEALQQADLELLVHLALTPAPEDVRCRAGFTKAWPCRSNRAGAPAIAFA